MNGINCFALIFVLFETCICNFELDINKEKDECNNTIVSVRFLIKSSQKANFKYCSLCFYAANIYLCIM